MLLVCSHPAQLHLHQLVCHLHKLPIAFQLSRNKSLFFNTTTKIDQKLHSYASNTVTTFQNAYYYMDFSLQASNYPYSKAIYFFPCQKVLWPKLAIVHVLMLLSNPLSSRFCYPCSHWSRETKWLDCLWANTHSLWCNVVTEIWTMKRPQMIQKKPLATQEKETAFK